MRAITLAFLVVTVAACFAAGRGEAITPMKVQHNHRYAVATKLARGIETLCHAGNGACGWRGLAFTLEDIGHREHINPAFFIGASCTEAGCGSSPCCGQVFDVWGWYGMPQASSWRDALTSYARFIHERWPQARDVWSFYGYCSCGFGFATSQARYLAARAWGDRTSAFMARMGFGGGRLSYP